jgi:hypothetical protein
VSTSPRQRWQSSSHSGLGFMALNLNRLHDLDPLTGPALYRDPLHAFSKRRVHDLHLRMADVTDGVREPERELAIH